MNKKILYAGIIFLMIVFISLYLWREIGGSNPTKVDIVSLKEDTLEETIIVPGKLNLANKLDIYIQPDKGEIESLLVKEGDVVERGTPLFEYSNESLLNEKKLNELRFRSQNLELENIRKQHRYIDEELEKDIDNKQLQIEHDEIKLRQQQINIEIEQIQLEKTAIEKQISETTVKSNIDGVVISIDEDALSESGQAEHQPIMQIGSLDTFLVKGNISEYDRLKVKTGQQVKLTSDIVPDQVWKGKVSFISNFPKLSELEEGNSDSIYALEVTLENKEINLKPGFKMLLEIVVDTNKVHVLPITAIEQDVDSDFVYVINDGIATRKDVELGVATNEVIEIKNGLHLKEKVILNSEKVTNGMEVDTK
ncbi:HlyD family secretion protein [Gracilibacillus halotolerans]|uniref:HlyD family secretion protein n=1 Tax=Gracilibacillus halotolerans TaxID=74386 RepID=A0A841RKH2_9BACI|nr:efflux RND transporter periplasmic adaptor subunit [Gracilibacillus halotolerans]MBB6512367.1 HlyD family secretion protein [Gracilibacillus halotolerans]